MGSIFKMEAKFTFALGDKIKQDSYYQGFIVEEKDIIHGYCYDHDGSKTEIRCLIGAFSKNDKGEKGMSLCKMPYCSDDEKGYEVVYTTPNVDNVSLAKWGIQYIDGITYLGHVDIKLEQLEWSEKKKNEILKMYNSNRSAKDPVFECYESNYGRFVQEIAQFSKKTKQEVNDSFLEDVMYRYVGDGVFQGKWPF